MAVMWHRHLEPTTVAVVDAAAVEAPATRHTPLLRFGVGLGLVSRFEPVRDRDIRWECR